MHYIYEGEIIMILFAFVLGDGEQLQKGLEIDEKLIKRIAKGDMDAFDILYRQSERTLYAYVLSLTKDHETTLDIMQDTYVKLISAAHLYKPMGKPLAWIFTIAKNLFYQKLRKEKNVEHMDPTDLSDDKRFSYVTDIEDRLVLEGVLKLLTQEEREIILLYAVSGMKHKEIAENLGLNLSTTLSKYHRALKKLRGYLEGRR